MHKDIVEKNRSVSEPRREPRCLKKQMLLFVRKGETTLVVSPLSALPKFTLSGALNELGVSPSAAATNATPRWIGGSFFRKKLRKKLSEKAFMIFYCDKESGDSISLVFFFLFLEVFFCGSGNSSTSPFSFMRASIICPMTV